MSTRHVMPDGEKDRTRFRAHVAGNPKGKHGAHEHDLRRYGLTPDMIRDRLGAYAERQELEIG